MNMNIFRSPFEKGDGQKEQKSAGIFKKAVYTAILAGMGMTGFAQEGQQVPEKKLNPVESSNFVNEISQIDKIFDQMLQTALRQGITYDSVDVLQERKKIHFKYGPYTFFGELSPSKKGNNITRTIKYENYFYTVFTEDNTAEVVSPTTGDVLRHGSAYKKITVTAGTYGDKGTDGIMNYMEDFSRGEFGHVPETSFHGETKDFAKALDGIYRGMKANQIILLKTPIIKGAPKIDTNAQKYAWTNTPTENLKMIYEEGVLADGATRHGIDINALNDTTKKSPTSDTTVRLQTVVTPDNGKIETTSVKEVEYTNPDGTKGTIRIFGDLPKELIGKEFKTKKEADDFVKAYLKNKK